MNMRIFICMSLCFLIQHVSAMGLDDLMRCKSELSGLYAIAIDTHKSPMDRLDAIKHAQKIVGAIQHARIQAAPKFKNFAFDGISWGNVRVLGGTSHEVDETLTSIECLLEVQRLELEPAEHDEEVVALSTALEDVSKRYGLLACRARGTR